MSLANFSKNGPRSGLSSEVSDRIWFGLSGSGFFDLRSGEGLDRGPEPEADGDGILFGSGDGVLGIPGSDLCAWVGVGASETEIRSGGASGGVLIDTNPGILDPIQIKTLRELVRA